MISIRRGNRIPVLYSFKNRICTHLEPRPGDSRLEQMAEVLSKTGYANVRRFNEVWISGLWPFGVGKGVRFSIYSIQPNIPDSWLLSLRHLIHSHNFYFKILTLLSSKNGSCGLHGFYRVPSCFTMMPAVPWESSIPILSSREASTLSLGTEKCVEDHSIDMEFYQ